PTRTPTSTATPTSTISSFPAAPTNLAGAASSSSQIHLTWKDNSSSELGFQVERSSDGSTFAQIATVGANVTSYSSTGLAPATNYWYRVRAYNAAGFSAYSTTVKLRTKPR